MCALQNNLVNSLIKYYKEPSMRLLIAPIYLIRILGVETIENDVLACQDHCWNQCQTRAQR